MVLLCQEVGVWCRTGYSSMSPLCGLGQNASLTLNNKYIFSTLPIQGYGIVYVYVPGDAWRKVGLGYGYRGACTTSRFLSTSRTVTYSVPMFSGTM